jgi:hypothetical protein
MFPAALIAGVLLIASESAAQTCSTPKPGPDWVCITGGGWVPPGHPDYQKPTTEPEPPNANGFKVGRTYQRVETCARVFIAALGQASTGAFVYAAECLDVSEADFCYFKGQGKFILASASTEGWIEIPSNRRAVTCPTIN